MASGRYKDDIPSNEEIISELTKDLENHQLREDNPPTSSNSANDVASNLEDQLDKSIPEDFDKSDSEEDGHKPTPLDDFIDEEQLKEIDATLTEEQKQERKLQADELKKLGNSAHKEARFLEAIEHYTQALRLCPLCDESSRSILYSNRAASKIQLKYKQAALDDCSKAVELNSSYVRAYLRRAKLYEETEKLDESLEDYKKVLELDPTNADALKATVRLPPLINERNEKLKTEMLGKLKDLGNMILKPFGLSTDNFQMQKDPTSGGYSVNFKQN